MTSKVEERPRLVMGGYGGYRSQWVKESVHQRTISQTSLKLSEMVEVVKLFK